MVNFQAEIDRKKSRFAELRKSAYETILASHLLSSEFVRAVQGSVLSHTCTKSVLCMCVRKCGQRSLRFVYRSSLLSCWRGEEGRGGGKEGDKITRSFRTYRTRLRAFQGRELTFKRPAEPSDVRWENLQATAKQKVSRRVCTRASFVGLLTISLTRPQLFTTVVSVGLIVVASAIIASFCDPGVCLLTMVSRCQYTNWPCCAVVVRGPLVGLLGDAWGASRNHGDCGHLQRDLLCRDSESVRDL